MYAAVLDRLQLLRASTLFMNAVYLMLSTFVVAAAGLVFWVVVTKGYDATAVGLATTLLSASGLLSLLGLSGFDTTFVRYLPGSDRKNDYINSGFIIVTCVSAAFAVGLVLLLPLLVPSLAILYNPLAFIVFVGFTVVTSLNTLTNAIFLAFKQARYILIINALFSGSKIVLPLVIARGNALTVFVLAGSAQLIGLVLSIVWLRRKFDYHFSLTLHMSVVHLVKKFSSFMYVSSILNLLPPTLLPLIIIYHLGPASAAYYYMAFMIAGVLYTIAYASMQSVFAEGSHDETAMGQHVVKAAKMVAALLLPAALVMIVASHFLLTLFGQEYAAQASSLLQLFVVGAVVVAVYSALGAIFKVTKNLHAMISMNAVYAVSILGLSYIMIPRWGIVAVGWAWVIGNLAACGMGAFFLIKNNTR